MWCEGGWREELGGNVRVIGGVASEIGVMRSGRCPKESARVGSSAASAVSEKELWRAGDVVGGWVAGGWR